MTAPGPLGDEARALVEAARGWVVRTFPGSHSAECRWCPVCRTVAALRDPAVSERVAGAVTAAAGTLATLLDSLTQPGPVTQPGPTTQPGPATGPDRARSGPGPVARPEIEPIPLDES
jgi:hypothetical protein